ncbi:MAG: hypothetical protein ABI444_13520 [Candidatus Kapaibacterium sp.]|jgi:hypothetical protein
MASKISPLPQQRDSKKVDSKTSDSTSDIPKLASPARRALANAGIRNLKDLTKITLSELSALHGMGPSAIKVLTSELKKTGRSFGKNAK